MVLFYICLISIFSSVITRYFIFCYIAAFIITIILCLNFPITHNHSFCVHNYYIIHSLIVYLTVMMPYQKLLSLTLTPKLHFISLTLFKFSIFYFTVSLFFYSCFDFVSNLYFKD